MAERHVDYPDLLTGRDNGCGSASLAELRMDAWYKENPDKVASMRKGAAEAHRAREAKETDALFARIRGTKQAAGAVVNQ